MEKLVFLAAASILILWIASIVVSMLIPSRAVNPSLQIAMVATTTFLFGNAWLSHNKKGD